MGVWTLVSNDNTALNALKRQLFVAIRKGILIIDGWGRLRSNPGAL